MTRAYISFDLGQSRSEAAHGISHRDLLAPESSGTCLRVMADIFGGPQEQQCVPVPVWSGEARHSFTM